MAIELGETAATPALLSCCRCIEHLFLMLPLSWLFFCSRCCCHSHLQLLIMVPIFTLFPLAFSCESLALQTESVSSFVFWRVAGVSLPVRVLNKVQETLFSCQSGTQPRTQALGGRGKERAWYPLFAHALNFPQILGNRKLPCYIRKTVTTKRILTATLSANFLTDDGSLLVIRSSAPSSSLQRLGTSNMSLKELQVASSLDVCQEKDVFIRLLLDKSM